jgi:Uma2 family endonuclease
MNSVVLDVNQIFDLSDEQFYTLCRQHPQLQFERSASGELIIMAPTGGISGNRNFSLTTQLGIWVEQHPDLGIGFDSSTCFKLPNGADRAPDVAWVRLDRWNALTPEQQEKFPPLAPDFVIELRSRTDDLETLRSKLREYQTNGVALALLINPQDQQVECYQANGAVEILHQPSQVDCSTVLPGFILQLNRIF